MSRPTDNPFVNFPPDYEERVGLTMLQSFALPMLLWFFDMNVGRGTGRSYMAAVLVLELAMRGNRVQLSGDPSLEFTREGGMRHRSSSHFLELVFKIADARYPGHIFSFNQSRFELVYQGKRPR